MMDYKLYCRLDIPGDSRNGIKVTIPPTQDVDDLKEAIIPNLPVRYKNTKPTDLKLYRIGGNEEPLDFMSILSDVFGPNGPHVVRGPNDNAHILVGLPESESANSALGGVPENLLHIVVVPPKADRPTTPHNRSESPIPFTPEKEQDKGIQDGVNDFIIPLKTTFDKFLKDNTQLPLWQPPLDLLTCR
jgi:hypothetical protein